jgi:hypothetical protein
MREGRMSRKKGKKIRWKDEKRRKGVKQRGER